MALPAHIIINAVPGQAVTIPVQFIAPDGSGDRIDAPTTDYIPQVMSVLMPNLAFAGGYPVNMARAELGLYVAKITLPAASANPSPLGSWVISILLKNPADGSDQWQIFEINVAVASSGSGGGGYVSPG